MASENKKYVRNNTSITSYDFLYGYLHSKISNTGEMPNYKLYDKIVSEMFQSFKIHDDPLASADIPFNVKVNIEQILRDYNGITTIEFPEYINHIKKIENLKMRTNLSEEIMKYTSLLIFNNILNFDNFNLLPINDSITNDVRRLQQFNNKFDRLYIKNLMGQNNIIDIGSLNIAIKRL